MGEPFHMQIMERDYKFGVPRPAYSWVPTAAQRAQALRNHGQTLERLNERGGVCWTELEGILNGVPWGYLRTGADAQARAKAVCLAAAARVGSPSGDAASAGKLDDEGAHDEH